MNHPDQLLEQLTARTAEITSLRGFLYGMLQSWIAHHQRLVDQGIIVNGI